MLGVSSASSSSAKPTRSAWTFSKMESRLSRFRRIWLSDKSLGIAPTPSIGEPPSAGDGKVIRGNVLTLPLGPPSTIVAEILVPAGIEVGMDAMGRPMGVD